MNAATAHQTRHLDDADLIRYIDAEGSSDETSGWEHHLALCSRCRHEIEALREQSRTVTQWLEAADFEDGPAPAAAPIAHAPARAPAAPRRVGRRIRPAAATGIPWLRAAVITLLLAAPLAALPPVRGWIAEQVSSIRGHAPAPADLALEGEAGTPADIIRFVPSPGTFLVVIDAPQTEGSLHVTRAPGPEAVLEVTGEGPRPEPIVSMRQVRIANTASATATYTLALPPDVDAVSVDIGGRRILLDAVDLDRTTTLRPLR